MDWLRKSCAESRGLPHVCFAEVQPIGDQQQVTRQVLQLHSLIRLSWSHSSLFPPSPHSKNSFPSGHPPSQLLKTPLTFCLTMTDQVGFGVQADVVSTASLSHMLTGRVLKALSDGGVDTYAIAAAFWLGAKMPVRPTLSDTVHSHVSRRRGMQSVLSKALSIGWGHSVPVVEMTRTRAGTNALLVIGALSTGTPAFQAAQCFSELLSAYGLEAEMLPTVDVLKGLVTYLAPFVHDLGFSKVLQHVDNTASRHFKISCGSGRRDKAEDEEYRCNKSLGRLQKLGDAGSLAKAVKQLVFTSERSQSHYMMPLARGSWLTAFASHILGMSVELRHDHKVLWACGGDRGSLIFQLGDDQTANNFSVCSSPQPLSIAPYTLNWEDNQRIKLDVLLEDALEHQATRWSYLDAEVSTAIHYAIKMLSMDLINEVTISLLPNSDSGKKTGFFMNGNFDNIRALENVLSIMRVESPTAKPSWLPRKVEGFRSMGPATNGIAYLERDTLERISGTCRFHYDDELSVSWKAIDSFRDSGYGRCPCESIGRLIHGFSCTAIALTRCRFNPSELRVQENIVSGETMTSWSRSCLLIRHRAFDRDPNFVGTYSATHDQYFDHLASLICPEYSDSWLNIDDRFAGARRKGDLVGLSGGTNTIYYSCIMRDDAFDEFGRMIDISSGRASVGGAFRNVIMEPAECLVGAWPRSISESLSDPSLLVGGSLLRPHHRPPLTNLSMDVTINESSIALQLRMSNGTLPLKIPGASFMSSINTFLKWWAVPSCEHSRDAVYETEKDSEVAIDGFHIAGIHQEIQADILTFALTGNKLEQLLTCGTMGSILSLRSGETMLARAGNEGKSCGVLQISSCLKCSICLSRQPDKNIGLPCVVMGG